MVTQSQHMALKLLWPPLTPAITHQGWGHLPLWVLGGFRSLSRLLWRQKNALSVKNECDLSVWRGWGSLSAVPKPCSSLLWHSRAPVVDASPLERHKSGHLGSYLWKRTQIRTFGVLALEKDTNLGHLGSLLWKQTQTGTSCFFPLEGPKPGHFGSILWKRIHAWIF